MIKQKINYLVEIEENTELKQPVYIRQRFLLNFIQHLQDGVSATDLQKLVFLYSMQKKLNFYNFIPYLYGAYSFQLAQDVDLLLGHGHLSLMDKKIRALQYSMPKVIRIQEIETLRGTPLIRKSYKEYPYYAINSQIADRMMGQLELSRIQCMRKNLLREKQVLFTIGYEGKTVESVVNSLIYNDIRVLCDVRQNPLSRKFGFSKSKLKHIVETIGIKYIHIPELGIDSINRKELRSEEDYNNLFEDYKRTLPILQNVLHKVYNLLNEHKRIVLMCYEKNPRFCHRKQIENYIVEHYDVESEDL